MTNKKYQRSSAKEVREEIRNHVLEFFNAEDYGTNTNIEALKKQVDYMRLKNERVQDVGIRLAEGGTLLVYNGEIEEFLDSLDCVLNTRVEPFENYKALIGREIDWLYKNN